jgi:DNA-binding NarL/FixJ family response regulator
MSDVQSRILPFPLAPKAAARQRRFVAGTSAVWPTPMSALALFRQNEALRAQNAALKLALDGRTAPLPRPATPEIDRDCLTKRQRQVLALVLEGCPSKNIAADLGISQRTVENHRAAIMQRTGATSIPALARIVIGAAHSGDCKAKITRHSNLRKAIPCRHATTDRKAPHAPD